jgi:hypothetical protein
MNPAAQIAGFSVFEFNWLPALYAHPARWGALRAFRPAEPRRGDRIVLRVSASLIEAERLAERSAAEVPPWLRLAAEPFRRLAERLGQVVLAERVRQALDRRAVLHSVDLLGPRAREQAYEDARRWPLLAALAGPAEPLPGDRDALAVLGGSVMAAGLETGRSGLRERLLLRFEPGVDPARTLSAPQLDQARDFLNVEAP